MFVRAEARGKGVARALCDGLIKRARELGYSAITLSALDKHDEAISLYKSLGFERDVQKLENDGAHGRSVMMGMVL